MLPQLTVKSVLKSLLYFVFICLAIIASYFMVTSKAWTKQPTSTFFWMLVAWFYIYLYVHSLVDVLGLKGEKKQAKTAGK